MGVGYYYFGEFGFFNMFIIPMLEIFYELNENEILNICTYKNYGMILENCFINVITKTIDWKFDEPKRQAHSYLDDELIKKLNSNGYIHNITGFSEHYSNIRNIHETFNTLPPTKYKLKRKLQYKSESVNGEKYINLFPRYRRSPQHNGRNVSKDILEQLLSELVKLQCKIVIHGSDGEMLDIQGNYIYPANVLEQIMYLNNSIVTISPHSGFAHFAVNCGSDLIVLHSDFGKYKQYNPFGNKIVEVNPYRKEVINDVLNIIANN